MTSILCIGDFGTGNQGQYIVADLLKYLIKKHNCKFILGLGDNIYPNGVKSINDSQFLEKFEIPYSNLSNNIKFFNLRFLNLSSLQFLFNMAPRFIKSTNLLTKNINYFIS